MENINTMLVLAIALLLAAATMAVLAVRMLRRAGKLRQSRRTARGIVTEASVNNRDMRSRSRMLTLEYEFCAGGTPCTGSRQLGWHLDGRYKKGDEIEIAYQQDNPKNNIPAELEGGFEAHGRTFYFVFTALVLFVAAFYLLSQAL